MEKHLTQHKKQVSGLPSINGGLSKKQIAMLADQSVDGVLEAGNVVQVAEALSAMEEFVKTVRKDERFVQFLRDELAKHHGRLITFSGAKIESCEAGVSYDYSSNGEWRELEARIKGLEAEKKMLEEKLRSLAPGRVAVDPETGEMLEGPLKSSKSTYRVTLSRA